jgi:hypothetical protein
MVSSVSNRRRFVRVRGPFNGVRIGLIDQPVRIYDLAEGGCFVTSAVEMAVGRQFELKVDLDQKDWITVTAESIYAGVRFCGTNSRGHWRSARAAPVPGGRPPMCTWAPARANGRSVSHAGRQE